MNSLQHYIDNQVLTIEQNLAAIADLQRQLNDLNQQIRIQQQIHQAQKTSQVEMEKALKGLQKLFRDICGIYPLEAIDSLVSDIQDIADEVKSNYQEYSQSNRFLNGTEEVQEDQEIQEIQEIQEVVPENIPLIADALPPESDDEIILSSTQVEKILNNIPENVVHFIKQQMNLSGNLKHLSSISTRIATNQVTHKRLINYIQAAEMLGVGTRQLSSG